MSQTVFGAPAVVTMLNRAFNNGSPGNAVFNNQVAEAGTTDASQIAFANAFGASFAGLSDAALSAQVLGNLGVLPNAELEAAVTQYFADNGLANRGLVVLQLGQILSTLETAPAPQDIFNAAAAAWNTEVEKSFIYSSNSANTTAYVGDFAPTPVDQGQTFTLTTGIDTKTGTGGNDTFIGDNTTSSAADQVDGGAGTDTLKLYGNATAPAYTGVEVVYLEGNTAGFNVSAKAEVTDLQLVDATTAQTYTIANGQKVSAATMLDTEVIDFAGNTVTALELTVNGLGTAAAGGVTVDLNSTAQTALTLKSATAASHVVLANTGTKLTTLNLSGDKALRVNADTNAVLLATVDASASTGGVTVLLDDAGTAKDVTATGGTGNDTFNFGATFTKGDKFNGGDGTDTLEISQASLTVVNGYAAADKLIVNDNLSNIEVVKITDALTSNIDASRFDNVNSFVLAAGFNPAATSTISGVTSGVSVAIGDAAGNNTDILAIEITDATLAGNNSDAVTLKLTDAGAAGSSDAGVVNLVGVDLLTIDTTQAAGGTTTGHVIDIAATSSALDKVTVVGNTALDISAVALVNSIAEVDASGMTLAAATSNGLTAAIATGGTNGVKITGSGGVDVLTGGDAADIIIGGAGNDTITGGKGNDVLTGGTGNDTFNFAAADSGITSSLFDSITDYSNGTVANTSDKLVFTTTAGVAGTTALAGFTLNAGVATKSGATLADFITAVQAVAYGAGETYAFVVGSDTYVYHGGAANADTTDDVLVKLVGVTATSVVVADTTVANEIFIG